MINNKHPNAAVPSRAPGKVTNLGRCLPVTFNL